MKSTKIMRDWATRSKAVTTALALVLATLLLSGCMSHGNRMSEDMDTVLVSDFLRFYLDGEMEMDRGKADCYDGICIQTDGERIIISLPEYYVFAGHHDEYITAHEGTIQERDGIKIGDVSLERKKLPDIPGVATDRTIKGYGGWGKYHGFDSLYYDYIRKGRPQRMVLASIGGWRSPGNPPRGTATWKGGAVAVDYSVLTEDRVLVGNTDLTVRLHDRLDEQLVYVNVTDLKDVKTGKTYEDMAWKNIPVRDGSFETFEIRGRFFGPRHEEVGGAFERDKIVGAFGAKKVE